MLTKIKMLAVLCCVSIWSYAQPTFNSGQDPKPSGKQWQKIENLSDEFNNGFNTNKWVKNIPGWEGRKPARFEEANASVSGGNLKLVAKTKAQPFSGWTHEGAAVRSKNNAPFGYYEVKMKANKTFMSSTFWLINESPQGTSSCNRRVTELDVVEVVGIQNGNSNGNFVKSMNSNSHSRPPWCPPSERSDPKSVLTCPWPAGCNYQTAKQGNTGAIGEPSWAGYHTYGVWYKNKDQATFFLDGRNVGTINLPSDFNLNMFLRFVVETYDWNGPSPGSDGMNRPLSERTTYYDWVRSWRLVDCAGNCGGGVTETLNCGPVPSSVTPSSTITVPVGYSTNGNRDVVIELRQNGQWKAGNKATVNGNSTVNIPLNVPAISGGGWQILAQLRPVGANWQQNITTCIKNVSIGSGGGGSSGGNPIVALKKQGVNFGIDGNNGGANGRQVYLWGFSTGNVNQQWVEINRGSGFYSYQKRNTNFCLDGGNGGSNGQAVKLWECGATNQNQHWKKVSTANNSFRLEKRNAPGYSIDGNVGGSNGQLVYLWASNSGNVNQQWQFSNVGTTARFGDEDLVDHNQFFVAPIPIVDNFTIDMTGFESSADLKIFDMKGRVVHQINAISDANLNLNKSIFPSGGMYFVRVYADNGVFTQKALVK